MTESNPYKEFTTGLIEQMIELAQFQEEELFSFKHIYASFSDIHSSRQDSFLNLLQNKKVLTGQSDIKPPYNFFTSQMEATARAMFGNDSRPVLGKSCTVDRLALLDFAEKFQIGTIRGRIQYTDGNYLSDDLRHLYLKGKEIDLMPQGNINNRSVLAKVLFNSYDLSTSYQSLKDDGGWSKITSEKQFHTSIKNAVYELNSDIKSTTGLKGYVGIEEEKVFVRPKYRK